MAETKLPRLLAAAKEFNIGQDTLIDFLIGKSFPKEDLKPTSKLTEEMYRALQSEFQSDKVAKMKSDQVDLPKGSLAEAKKKKEEEDILFKTDKKTVIKKEEPVVAEVETPVAKVAEPKEEEVVKIEAPELPSPKVITKIDLSVIDSSTRPKKTTKKKSDQEAELPPVEEKSEEISKTESADEKKKTKKQQPEEKVAKTGKGLKVEKVEQATDEEPLIENIKAEKIEGPRILGKIDLPADSDTRPVKDEKRKRKRIFIEKREVKPDTSQNRDRRPGGGPGGFNRDQRGRSGGTGGGGHRPIIRRDEKLIDEKEKRRRGYTLQNG